MPSALELMLLSQDRDDDMQRAISSRLRRRQEIGELAQLTGDRVLTPMGKQMVDNVSEATRLEMAREDKRKQRELTRGYYDQIAQQHGLTHALAVRRQEEIERQNEWLRENGSLAEHRFAYTQLRNQEQDLRRLGQDMQKAGVPEMNRLASEINELTGPYFEGGEFGADADIPGMGATARAPNWMLSSEGGRIKRAMAELNNRLLRIRSGAAVTTPEAQRLAEEIGYSLERISTDDEFRRAWPQIAEGLRYIEASVTAGYAPEIVSQYTEQFNRALGTVEAAGQSSIEEGFIDDGMTPESNPQAIPTPRGQW